MGDEGAADDRLATPGHGSSPEHGGSPDAPRTPVQPGGHAPPGWLDRVAWARARSGQDCALCADVHLAVNRFSYLVAELERSYVRLPRNQFHPGYTLVALKRHANELFELEPAELAGFWAEVAAVARAVDALYRPAKINYGVFGNLCPHIHCHVVPQAATDDPTRPLDMQPEIRLSEAEYAERVATLRAALQGQAGRDEA